MYYRNRRFALSAFAIIFLLMVGSISPCVGRQASGQSDSTGAAKKSSTKKPKKPESTTTPQTPANPPAAPATTPENKPAPPTTGAGSAAAATNQTPQPSPSGTVWVNTVSGIYHKPGSRYYGKTRKGQYMTEADALRAGYRPAENEKKR